MRLDRQDEIEGGAGRQSHRNPQRPTLALRGEREFELPAQGGDQACDLPLPGGRRLRRPFPGQLEIHSASSSEAGLGGGGRPVLDPPAQFVTSIIAETGPNVTARRHQVCPLPDRLPPYWRGEDRTLQLGLCPAPWRPHAAAHRGHRPGALDRTGDRGHSRGAQLARPRFRWRAAVAIRPGGAPSRDCRGAAAARPGLSLLLHGGGARRDAGAGGGRRASAAL